MDGAPRAARGAVGRDGACRARSSRPGPEPAGARSGALLFKVVSTFEPAGASLRYPTRKWPLQREADVTVVGAA